MEQRTKSKRAGNASLGNVSNVFSKLFSGRLIPTTRVDKNGRVVIRHMKPAVSNERRVLFPLAVSSMNQNRERREQVLNGAAHVLFSKSYLPASYREHESKRLKKLMKNFSTETVAGIASLDIRSNSPIAYYVHLELKDETNEDHVRDLLQLSGFLEGLDVRDDDCVLSLKRYENIYPLGEHGSYPEERYRQVTRLIRTMMAMKHGGARELESSVFDYAVVMRGLDPVPRIADKNLVEMVLDATDSEYEQIVSIMEERSMFTPDEIKGLMGGPSALSSGAL